MRFTEILFCIQVLNNKRNLKRLYAIFKEIIIPIFFL